MMITSTPFNSFLKLNQNLPAKVLILLAIWIRAWEFVLCLAESFPGFNVADIPENPLMSFWMKSSFLTLPFISETIWSHWVILIPTAEEAARPAFYHPAPEWVLPHLEGREFPRCVWKYWCEYSCLGVLLGSHQVGNIMKDFKSSSWHDWQTG